MIKAKLLLVEDEENLLRMFRIFLDKADYLEVKTASNGGEAMERLRQEFIPIIVTDLKMPVMSGFQLIEEARKSREIRRKENIDQIFIVVSSMTGHDDIHRALTLGAYDVIAKPLVRDLFLAKIRNYYGLYRLMLESEERYQKAGKLNEEITEGYENRILENQALADAMQRQKEIYAKQIEIIKKIQSLAGGGDCGACAAILEQCGLLLEMENLGR